MTVTFFLPVLFLLVGRPRRRRHTCWGCWPSWCRCSCRRLLRLELEAEEKGKNPVKMARDFILFC